MNATWYKYNELKLEKLEQDREEIMRIASLCADYKGSIYASIECDDTITKGFGVDIANARLPPFTNMIKGFMRQLKIVDQEIKWTQNAVVGAKTNKGRFT